MRTLILSLVLAACTSTSSPDMVDAPSTPAPVGDDVTLIGTVVSLDRDPMAYDGNAVLLLDTDDGERRVEIPARTNLCQATGLDVALNAEPGQRLHIVGERFQDAVVPCVSAEHSIRRIDS